MYYFFKTSTENRGGEMKPTLRALPGQTFEDGTPVDTNLNVQAPKEAGSSPNGARLEYPQGTVFCSDYLALDQSRQVPFYSVYKDLNKTPNFHPVLTDPKDSYISGTHRNQEMEAAYALFCAGINPNAENNTSSDEAKEKTIRYSPADEAGLANNPDPAWMEKYLGQLEDESAMFGKWIRGLFSSKNVTLPSRIVMSTVSDEMQQLYSCGENIDTLASRSRFEKFLKEKKIDYGDFANLSEGPHRKYICWILDEHKSRTLCTAQERNVSDISELQDAVSIIEEAHCNTTGVTSKGSMTDIDNFRKAIEAGWSLSEILDPELLKKTANVTDLASKLATGAIPLPVKVSANGATTLEKLLAENRKPKDSEGFHVDEMTWKILLRNLNAKQNTMLTGPSGSGKTEIISLLCKRTGTPLTIIQMGAITDPTEQLAGKFILNSTGEILFDMADFALAIQKPGVILLDEINRMPKNGENMLFSCLDNTRELPIYCAKSSENRVLKVHPDCCFVATANIGYEFTGTKTIDQALNTRFMKVELDYMKQSDEVKIIVNRTGINEEDAENIAFVANRLRKMAISGDLQSSVSTRETLLCADLVKDGFTVKEAMELVYLPLYDKGQGNDDSQSERAQAKLAISQRFNNEKPA